MFSNVREASPLGGRPDKGGEEPDCVRVPMESEVLSPWSEEWKPLSTEVESLGMPPELSEPVVDSLFGRSGWWAVVELGRDKDSWVSALDMGDIWPML